MNKMITILITSLLLSSSSLAWWSPKQIAEFLDKNTTATPAAKEKIMSSLGSNSGDLSIRAGGTLRYYKSPGAGRSGVLQEELNLSTGERLYSTRIS